MNFFMAALPERGGVGGWVADQGVTVEPVCARPIFVGAQILSVSSFT